MRRRRTTKRKYEGNDSPKHADNPKLGSTRERQ